jgi:DNA processing protein
MHEMICLTMVSGIGPSHYRLLVDHLGSPGAVLEAPFSRLVTVPGIGARLAERIQAARTECNVEFELAECERLGVCIITADAAEYPAALRTITHPPILLYVRGRLLPRDQLAIGVVGSRHCTHYGLRQAERLAGSLARMGFTIVSGLARGIDGAAHRGALAAGGRTIAVLASGVGNIYPPDHRELAEQIVRSGALVSEKPISFQPMAGLFPQRNRIIAGLSLGVLVVEAGLRSGALITARHALEQNREVLAVPGPVDSLVSRGCHRLLRDGARLVETADDVLDTLGPLIDEIRPAGGNTIRHPLELTLDDLEREVLKLVGPLAESVDEIVARSHKPTQQVLAALSALEMRRLIRRLSGNLYVRR